MRIGTGYDIHPFTEGRALILGGVDVPHGKGLAGHSDADALAHAVGDALLGAMGAGDLGTQFPSGDPTYKDISSLALLQDISELLAAKGFRVVNVDSVIIAQAPRLSSYLSKMAENLAGALSLPSDLVNVKVKSGEALGAIGREEAIAAHAVCLIESITKS